MDKPKRETVWVDYDIVSDGREMYDADEMDEWLKAEVLPVLRDMCAYAVVLCEDYLKTFEREPDDKCVQGWDLGRWRKAVVAYREARALIAKMEPTDE